MDIPAVLDHALAVVEGNQAELARRVGRSETAVSRWVAGRNGLDYESALRLARITGLNPVTVLDAAGLDSSLIGPPPDTLPNWLQRSVAQHCRDMNDVVAVLEGVPEDDLAPIREILDRAQADIRKQATLIARLYAAESTVQTQGKLLAASSARRSSHPVQRQLRPSPRALARDNSRYSCPARRVSGPPGGARTRVSETLLRPVGFRAASAVTVDSATAERLREWCLWALNDHRVRGLYGNHPLGNPDAQPIRVTR